VKIQRIVTNERKRLFEVHLDDRTLSFPYVRADPRPVRHDRVTSVTVYAQLAHRGFGNVLASGRRGLVHLDQVFAYNEDPRLLRDGILYKLTLEAQRRVATSDLARRELLRRLGTSPAQLYRILDPANGRKTVDQVLSLLHVLDCEVEVIVRDKSV